MKPPPDSVSITADAFPDMVFYGLMIVAGARGCLLLGVSLVLIGCQLILPYETRSPDDAAVEVVDSSADLTRDLLDQTPTPDAPWMDAGPAMPGTWVTINAGTFTMGSPVSEPCRDYWAPNHLETQHEVTLTHGFEISVYETTQAEFESLMGYNPSGFTSTDSGCGSGCYCSSTSCSDNPVERVNWHQAAAYCNKLSLLRGLGECYTCQGTDPGAACDTTVAYQGKLIYSCPGYRLPTEAEWEDAYRAGTATAYYSGPNIDNCNHWIHDPFLDSIGWYEDNSGLQTHPRGQKAPNSWNLYDMAGNVWEWCHDPFQQDLGASPVTDPAGPLTGNQRVIRGGAHDYPSHFARAAMRAYDTPDETLSHLGFRPVRTLPASK
jgi:formylglycine-generating enzyme required for sulfatase activity